MTGNLRQDSLHARDSCLCKVPTMLVFTLTGKRTREFDDGAAYPRHHRNDSDKREKAFTNSSPHRDVPASNYDIYRVPSNSSPEELPRSGSTASMTDTDSMRHLSVGELRKLAQTTK